jgi:hypothetical protein
VVRELVDAIQHDLLELHLVEVLAALERAPTAETQPILPTMGAPVPPNSEEPAALKPPGIDLSTYYEDVRRLTWRFGASWCMRHNVEVEELISDVVTAIASRNLGRSAWDPSRGMARSSYIVMIVRQRISNLARSRSSLSRRPLDEGVEVDVLGRAHLPGEQIVEPSVTPTLEAEVDLQRAVDRARNEDNEILDSLVAGERLAATIARLKVPQLRVSQRRQHVRRILESRSSASAS